MYDEISILNLVRPFLPILPEITAPERKIPFQSRVSLFIHCTRGAQW